ncbi:MAG TPA: hypothetical protein ENJ06_05915, partial [Phycisphaeraceae bacterium]|nr:hypothetical protein [Phycisphaeraceae bacterium]
MKVLILSRMPLCGIPLQLARALNCYTEHEAHCVVIRDHYADGRRFRSDLVRSEMDSSQFISLLDGADIIHFFNYVDPDNREFGVSFPDYIRGKRLCIQYHSQPEHIAEQTGLPDTSKVIARDYIQLFVTAEYLRLYDPAITIPIPIIIPLDDERFKPARKWSEDDGLIHIAYSPSGRSDVIPGWRKWTSKGYSRTCEAMYAVEKDMPGVKVHVIEGVSHSECCDIKKHCDIAIDEVVSGAYHTNSLETLAMGVATVCHIDDVTEEVNSRITGVKEHPWIDATLDNLYDVLSEWVSDKARLRERQEYSRAWMEKYWNDSRLAALFSDLYEGLPVYNGKWSRERAISVTCRCARKRPQLIRGVYSPEDIKTLADTYPDPADIPAPAAATLNDQNNTVIFYPVNENHVIAFDLLYSLLKREHPDIEVKYIVPQESADRRPLLAKKLRESPAEIFTAPVRDIIPLMRKYNPGLFIFSTGDNDPWKILLMNELKRDGCRCIAIEEGNQLTLNDEKLSFYTLPFDHICAASESERECFCRAGFNRDIITVTGSLSAAVSQVETEAADPVKVRNMLGLEDGQKLAVYTTSPLRRYQPNSFETQAVRDAVLHMISSVGREDVVFVIKLHPAEASCLDYLKDILPGGTRVICNEFTFPQLLAAADVIINRGNSMTALQAVSHGVPAVIIPQGLHTVFDKDYPQRFVVTEKDKFTEALDVALNSSMQINASFRKLHLPAVDPVSEITCVIADLCYSSRRKYTAEDAFLLGVKALARGNHSSARICFTSSPSDSDIFTQCCHEMNGFLDFHILDPKRALAHINIVLDSFDICRELITEAMLLVLESRNVSESLDLLSRAVSALPLFGESESYLPALRFARKAVRMGISASNTVLDELIDDYPELMEALTLR